ncbi:MAG: hypothetical protein A3B68_05520 [Candidatus Melainabacteria bacterium RIFCSPHIGHO2_02_FULL_34_12]|nr:MAG: hypothetical protein A3B68_05520 [Candidatus Melainabacteria bacterium RIFCSPHIGHO2_02_FULL_34_12]
MSLIVSGITILAVISWQFKEIKQLLSSLSNDCKNIAASIKQNTDIYFWILLGSINLIYITSAISTIKLNKFGSGNTHVFNVNQLLNDIYPLKYLSIPGLNLRYHYGADILAGTLSKISGSHPEISFDVLTILFLNLIFLLLYILSSQFLSAKKINRYLVPFGAFLAWAPITTFFIKEQGEKLPINLLDKVYYLTQNKLIASAEWSGLVLHWFFEPSFGIGCFFFLLGVYLTYKLFTKEQNIKFALLVGVFLSSLVIIDVSKLVILFLGIFIHLLLSYALPGEWHKIENEKILLRNLGIMALTAIVLGVLFGNAVRFDKNLVPFVQLYKLGQTNIDFKHSPLESNFILLLIYAFGFFQAYKLKHSWGLFILPFFISALAIPYLVSIPEAGAGKVFISANIIGAFSLPFALNFAENQFKLKEIKLTAFYAVIMIALSICTMMFFIFGDKNKPLFFVEHKLLKFSGLQQIPASVDIASGGNDEEIAFTKYLKNKNVKNETILTEPQYVDVFINNTGLSHIIPSANITDTSIKKELLDKSSENFKAAFLLDPKIWVSKKINWLYMTPRMFRSVLSPQTRKILLNAYLNKGVKLGLSNNKNDDPLNLKELYEVEPKTLSQVPGANFEQLLGQLLESNDNRTPAYIKEIADCPYLGSYSTRSNDFDGDKIADIGFYDQARRVWHIIYGKDQSEKEIDLNKVLLSGLNSSELLVPVPADYDGDSKSDIALFNKSNSTWYILKSQGSQSYYGTWCGEWSEMPLPADVDGDGKTDTSCYNSFDRRWPTYKSTTENYYTNTFDTSVADTVLYSDIDGDKKADYIIFKPNLGEFNLYLSSCLGEKPTGGSACGGSNTPTKILVTVGSLTSRVVPADYDGDGKVDLATWTPENGKWDIAYAKDFVPAKSGTSHYSFTLGKAGDIPMPADYNGDGKADIAIYHFDTNELEISFENRGTKKINLSKYKNFTPASFIGV